MCVNKSNLLLNRFVSRVGYAKGSWEVTGLTGAITSVLKAYLSLQRNSGIPVLGTLAKTAANNSVANT
ncbi:hypothetical protein QKD39_gp38 [Psittacine adenovirus 1]|uniref:Uncharacterized protein n=1 Tax=Psittacine adenovirus 1 TaxID=318592 RepID=A0A2Z5E041_9ADEN|nr:hypothetical protein QKD39_gp38 [Psittacine adenovirus 1]AXB73025.1 hypothetical protein [Psittacine adenovirus 1]